MINDYEMLYLIHMKDEEALSILLKKYESKISGMIKKVVEGSNYHYFFSDEKQELLHRAKIALIEAIDLYEDSKVPFSYFVQICVTSAIRNYMRAQRGCANYMLSTSLSLDLMVNEAGGSYLSELVESRNKESDPRLYAQYTHLLGLIEDFEKTLDEKELKIWKMRQAGFTYREIAEQNDCSIKRVGYVLARIKKKLSGIID